MTRIPLEIIGDHQHNTLAQMYDCLKHGSALAGVLCADGHLGYAQPVGGVVAYENHISIDGVGFDIGCGNLAVKLDAKRSDLNLDALMVDIPKHITFGAGGVNPKPVDHPIFDDRTLWRYGDVEDLLPTARAQLGTTGSGNHYVDLFEDAETGHVWIGVHFGSRGLGHRTATKYLILAGGRYGPVPALVEVDSDLGHQYRSAMKLAGDYAHAGRKLVVDIIRKMIGAHALDEVHNHHNYAWAEDHPSLTPNPVWVIRKGATPAYPGMRGFIGGSMGDEAVIVRGIEHDRPTLYSTIHGAGRTHSRRQAKQTFTREDMNTWLQTAGVRLHGGDLDESPMAYRRLDEVLAYHVDTIAIEHRLRPFAVFMA